MNYASYWYHAFYNKNSVWYCIYYIYNINTVEYKFKLGEYPRLEFSLSKWYKKTLNEKIPINGTILREKTLQ